MTGQCEICYENTLECKYIVNIQPLTGKEITWSNLMVNEHLPIPDNVNHPSHYQGQKFEVIDIIEDFNLGFNLGNAIKYILRASKKGLFNEDLKKAIWYLQREIDHPS